MKLLLLLLFFFLITAVQAQKKCDYAIFEKDSTVTYKETKACLVYERILGGKSTLIFITLANKNDIPFLKLEYIQKSTEFEVPKCLSKNSKIYFQLANGKIYTMVFGEESVCDNLYYNEKDKTNNRLLDVNFFFLKDNFEDLMKHPVSIMRIKFADNTTEDYVLAKELISETLKESFFPEKYFQENFSCITN